MNTDDPETSPPSLPCSSAVLLSWPRSGIPFHRLGENRAWPPSCSRHRQVRSRGERTADASASLVYRRHESRRRSSIVWSRWRDSAKRTHTHTHRSASSIYDGGRVSEERCLLDSLPFFSLFLFSCPKEVQASAVRLGERRGGERGGGGVMSIQGAGCGFRERPHTLFCKSMGELHGCGPGRCD